MASGERAMRWNVERSMNYGGEGGRRAAVLWCSAERDGSRQDWWRAQWQRGHGGSRHAGAGNLRQVQMTFLETAEDDSRTNRVEEGVDILVGPFMPSRPTVKGAFLIFNM
jgi:hypothetical protein